MKLAVCLLALLVGGQGKIFYQDLNGTFRISNVKEGEGGSAQGLFSFNVTGDPLVVAEKVDLGLKVTAPKLDGKLANKYLQELHTHDGTIATLETQEGTTEFKTEKLDYEGTETKGVFTIPGAFTLSSKSEGLAEGKKFTQTIDAKGVSGSFNLNPAAKKMPLLSGTIEGPMTFDLVRSETAADKTEVTKLNGSADRAIIDMEKERTVTLAGHVKVRGENGAFIGTSEAETVILYLDESLNLVKVRLLGEPTRNTAREKKGGGVKK